MRVGVYFFALYTCAWLVSMMAAGSSILTVDSVIRGHHIYKVIWTPTLGVELQLMPEEDNIHDNHAVAVMKEGNVVGHMPRSLLPMSWFFIKRGGSISCEVTGHQKFGIGLEVPCTYTYRGSKRMISKVKKIIITLQ